MISTSFRATRGIARFHAAQKSTYGRAIREIQRGNKQGHWMWFIFPQLAGLAKSETARYYGIADRAEAVAYLDDPVLRVRLYECASAVLGHDRQMFRHPDNHKLRSSMTLFAEVSSDPKLPRAVLAKFFDGPDQLTLDLLAGKKITLPPSRTVRPIQGSLMGNGWERDLQRARATLAAAGQRRLDREPWRRERVMSFVRGFGLSSVATRQMVDAWMADQSRARREGWEEGHDEGVSDAWDDQQEERA